MDGENNGKPYLKWMIWGYPYIWKHPYQSHGSVMGYGAPITMALYINYKWVCLGLFHPRNFVELYIAPHV